MKRYIPILLAALALPACPAVGTTVSAPAAPNVASSVDTTENSPRGLDTPLPAPKLDPEGEAQYAFIAESREKQPDPENQQSTYKFVGHAYSIAPDPNSPKDRIDTPLEAGRWVMAQDDDHHVCAVAAVGEGGSLSITLVSPGNIEFIFAVARTGYTAASAGNLDSCPLIYGGTNPEDYDFFLADFLDKSPSDMRFTFAPQPTSDGIQHPANSGIQHPASSGIQYPANPSGGVESVKRCNAANIADCLDDGTLKAGTVRRFQLK